MKRILVIVFSNLKHDARVKRQINFLTEKYEVTVLCFGSPEMQNATVIQLRQTPLTFARKAVSGLLLLLRFYKTGHRLLYDYSHIKDSLKMKDFDLIIANDVETLPLAFKLSQNKKILFDAHEYAPRHFEDKLWWRVFFKGLNNYLCKKYIPSVSAMTTVGKGLADEYHKTFQIKPTVITNATRYYEIQPSPVLANKIRMVYHGIANPSRKIELMVGIMSQLDERFTLDMILMTSEFASGKTRDYIQQIKTSIQGNNRIRILPPLASEKVVPFINQYDVGIFLIPPVNFNYANTLPNKLFEYIQARLAIAVGPTPEMAEIVNKYRIGVVSDDFYAASLARKLKTLTPESLGEYKSQSSVAAKELCAEKNKVIFLKEVDNVIENVRQ